MSQKTISFVKMTGAGNDFLILEPLKGVNLKTLALTMCDRTNGIGADGILILERSKKADYKMRIINADGSEAEMCGNGARCMATYIVRYKKPSKKLFGIETPAGIILAEASDEIATIRLSEPKDYRPDVFLTIQKRKLRVQYIDTGVPHAVILVEGLPKIDVRTIGRMIRYHKKFAPRGTNVNFIEQIKPGLIAARTYERGVEDETRACGTGSVASALIAFMQMYPETRSKTDARMKVMTQNWDILDVTFDITDNRINNVWLKGPAKFIAQGHFFIS